MSDKLVNTITQYGFHADEANLQDSCNMTLSQHCIWAKLTSISLLITDLISAR